MNPRLTLTLPPVLPPTPILDLAPTNLPKIHIHGMEGEEGREGKKGGWEKGGKREERRSNEGRRDRRRKGGKEG